MASGRPAKYINFPDRTTECGGLINSFLTNKKDFNDETIHLLFTLNRWEAKNEMEKMLNDGVTLIVDRYSFSGVAFSVAKGLDIDWCKAPEAGLLKPDMVLMLNMTALAISKRGGFGDERFVKIFQTIFHQFFFSYEYCFGKIMLFIIQLFSDLCVFHSFGVDPILLSLFLP